MNTFPFIKTKWSNESIMAALYLLLILYHIPLWCEKPSYIINFILLSATGLVLDAVVHVIRYKRLWCCVSAAVTAAIISFFTQGVPVRGQILGLIVALIMGKHIWGGTGKNWINPAMVGLLIILLFWNIPPFHFGASYYLLPAVILSLPFLKSRPYAGIGFIAGAIVVLLISNDLSLASILSNGVLFWGCIVMTDPVTITRRPLGGLIAGCIAGFFAFYRYNDILIIITLVLSVNLYSYITDNFIPNYKKRRPTLKIPSVVSDSKEFLDLVKEDIREIETDNKIAMLTPDQVIDKIRDNEVFGMGGAAFPTDIKISTVLSAAIQEKYMVINGVECDPGLIHDYYLLRNYPNEITKGINILRSCIEFKSVMVAVSDNRELNLPQDINIYKIQKRYPMGAEKFLIKEIFNKSLEKNQLPAEHGILVLNVQTVYSIYKAVYENSPSDTRYITVADMSEKTAKVAKVRLGMKLKNVMEAAYPNKNGFITGGGVMQAHFADEDETVDPSTNFIAIGTIPRYKESVQCSRCGNCVDNCPAGLEVNKIAALVNEGKMKETLRYNTVDCMSCGSCSYSCLAGRNLAAKINAAKEFAKKL